MKKIQREQFEPVDKFLSSNEFAPHIVDGEAYPRLEKVVLQEEKDDAAQKIASVYRTASMLQCEALQTLCLEKWRVLAPLTPATLLIVLHYVYDLEHAPKGCEAEHNAKDWLTDHLVEYFMHVWQCEGMTLQRCLQGNKELRKTVWRKLGENLETGMHGLDQE